MTQKTLLLMLAAGLLAGCAAETTSTAYERDGVSYGQTDGAFRGRWWSYYERGSSFLAGEYYAEAAGDFQKAIEGRSTDSWRARTYGLHFVEFFPNRELGVAYYGLEQFDQAETYLARSLEQVDTERAHYYLDLVKRAKIASGALQDTTTPAVQTDLADQTLVTTRQVAFAIDAKDDVGVAEVQVNGQQLHQRGSAEAVVFEEELVLEEGTHEIEVAATDLADKKVVEKKEVVVDLTGPTIGIFAPIEPTVTPEGTVILEGATVDTNGVISVGVDDRVLAESPGAPRLEFNTELPLTDGENTFVLAALDKAGNESRSAVKVFRGDPNSYQAKLWLLEQTAPERLKFASNTTLTLAMLDAMLAQVPEATDEIRVKSPLPNQPYRHNRTLTVSGEVVAKSKVTGLTINGEPFTQLTGAPKESFNRRIPIDATEATKVTVAIEATEENGQTLSTSVEVDVQPVQLDTRESKMPVAIMDFTGAKIDAEMMDRLRLNCERAIFDQARFNLVDRQQLQTVLTEQGIAAGGLADPATAIRIGKLVSAYALMTGDVLTRGEKGIEVAAKIIDTETSQVMGILDAFVEDASDTAAVERACDSIATQLKALYPRLSGEILLTKPSGDRMILLINWTKEDAVPEGAYVLAVHQEPPFVDDTTGEVLMEGETIVVGRARVTKVSTSAMAETIELGQEGVTLEKGMPAITM